MFADRDDTGGKADDLFGDRADDLFSGGDAGFGGFDYSNLLSFDDDIPAVPSPVATPDVDVEQSNNESSAAEGDAEQVGEES